MKAILVSILLLGAFQARAADKVIRWSPSVTRQAMQILKDNHQMDNLRAVLKPDTMATVEAYSQLADNDPAVGKIETAEITDAAVAFIVGFVKGFTETFTMKGEQAKFEVPENFDLDENLLNAQEPSVKMVSAPQSWNPKAFPTQGHVQMANVEWAPEEAGNLGEKAGRWVAKTLHSGTAESAAYVDDTYFDLNNIKQIL